MAEETYRDACGQHSADSRFLAGIADRLKRGPVAQVMTKLLELRHPGSLESLPRPLASPPAGPGARLQPATALRTGRYGWPAREFTEDNSVLGEFGSEPWISLKAGDAAVDFTLPDEHDRPCSLSALLETRPVVLTFGMYTCPAYQISKAAEIALVHRFAEDAHFLHLYSLEPHPKGSPAPDTGKPWELRYSTHPQAYTRAERARMRAVIVPDHPDCQRILLDALDPEGLINPVWSTYGPAPRPGFLIRQDGIIDTSQLWFAAGHMEAALRRLLMAATHLRPHADA